MSSEFVDEPKARALYEKMLDTAREAETMHYRSDYECDLGVMKLEASYEIWMKKPGYARIEVQSPAWKRSITGTITEGWLSWASTVRIARRSPQSFLRTWVSLHHGNGLD